MWALRGANWCRTMPATCLVAEAASTRSPQSGGFESVLNPCKALSPENCMQTLVRDSTGNLYGTVPAASNTDNTYGVFRIAPDGTERPYFTRSTRPSISGMASRSIAPANLYGTTSNGGTNGTGSIFKLDQESETDAVVLFYCCWRSRRRFGGSSHRFRCGRKGVTSKSAFSPMPM